MKPFLFCCLALFAISPAQAATWRVGPTRTYTRPSQVSALVSDGDLVLIDAGTYYGDTASWSASNLTLSGFGGMAWLNSGGHVYGDKAIWVINGANTKVSNIEFSGAIADPSSNNGAGIRQQGSGLTVSHCYFHDNQDGILTNPDTTSDVLIEYSEFSNNGIASGAGSGYCHNLYVGNNRSLTFQFNYSHDAIVGHELKSRAIRNNILYNRFSDEATGTASRSIDLPNGGTAIIMGNIIEKGPLSQNSNTIEFGLEGLTNSDSALYIVNNTFANDRGGGSFVIVQPGTRICAIQNNIFAGDGNIIGGTASELDSSHNYTGTEAGCSFADTGTYNYHLLAGSPAIDNGGKVDSIPGDTLTLVPVYEYVHPAADTLRPVSGKIDIGAYEYNAPTRIPPAMYAIGGSMEIIPNPAQGKFIIAFSGVLPQRMSIHAASGELVYQSNSVKQTNNILLRCPAGMYFVSAAGADCLFQARVLLQ